MGVIKVLKGFLHKAHILSDSYYFKSIVFWAISNATLLWVAYIIS